MQGYPVMKCFCAVFCIIIVVAEITSAAPAYTDYESSIRDLYDYLMQKEALEDRLASAASSSSNHQMVRKSSRSPSLRLRFGRRSDPNMLPISPYMLQQEDHADN